MADRKLAKNVFVESDEVGRGDWYGPSYPQNKVTAEVAAKITNPGAWEDSDADVGAGDFRFRADDFGGEEVPHLRAGEGAAAGGDETAELEKLTKDELLALAEARQVDVKTSASKSELVAALRAQG